MVCSYSDWSGHVQQLAAKSGRWHYALFNTPVEVPALINNLIGRMREAGFPLCDRDAIRLAVDEAIRNALDHGHRGDLRKTVVLNHCVADAFVIVQVEDEGPGFHVETTFGRGGGARSKLAGRGLQIIFRCMDAVEFNAAGNCVTLCKRRSPNSGSGIG